MDSLLAFLSMFDGRTAVLLVTLAFFIQALALGSQFFLVREYKGLGTALLGNFSLAVGFALLLFRGILPDLFTIIVANILIALCPVLYHFSASQFTGQKPYTILSATSLVGIILLLLYFTYIHDHVGARIVSLSLVLAFNIFLMLTRFWRARREPYRFGILMIMVPFGLYMLILILRSIVTILSPPSDLFVNSPMESATYLFLFIVSFMWTIGYILMVSQRLQIDLSQLATTDALTRIPNRRATQTFFEKEFSRKHRHGGEFSILSIDLDNFKQINDMHGHDAGDLVLVKAAKVFQDTIRRQDIVGRWGGEEFLVILPNTTARNAQILAERLRLEISNAEFDYGKTSTKVTVSIGIAAAGLSESMEEILKKADKALYTAKKTKNQVVIAQ